MKLTKTEIDHLYPKLNLSDYERSIRSGFEIAEKSSLLVWSTTKTPDLELIQDLTEVFKTSRLTTEEPRDWQEDFLLKLDKSVVFCAVDGILNSIGWSREINWGTFYGTLRNRRFEIVNRGRFNTRFQGDSIEWNVGNFPMPVVYWGTELYLLRKEGIGDLVNPSLVGLL